MKKLNPKYVVYMHTSPSGKSYIGRTVLGMERRWYLHVRKAEKNSDTWFHQAIRKYGPENFTHTILYMSSEKDLRDEEQQLIETYDTYRNGYNMRERDGGLTPGYNHSNETKKKMSKAARGRKKTKEHIAKVAKTSLGNTRRLGTGNHYIIWNDSGIKLYLYGVKRWCDQFSESIVGAKLNPNEIREVAKGAYKRHKGFFCKLVPEAERVKEIDPSGSGAIEI